MAVCGRLRVREYNTLHRAIRRSRWGPVRCTIALYLKMEMVKGYAHSVWNTESIADRANRGRISFIRNYAQQSSSVSRGKCREERTICGTNSNKFPLWCRSWHREDKKPSESNAQLRASPSQGRTKDIIPHTTYFDCVGTIWRGIEMYNSKELLRKRLRSPSKYHE